MCVVYQISKPGEIVLTDWGPSGSPLSPIAAVEEGKRIAQAVATGELTLTVLLSGLPRRDAAGIIRLLNPQRRRSGPIPVAIVRETGGIEHFPSIRAAAASLGMVVGDFSRSLHRLDGVAVYCVPNYKSRKKPGRRPKRRRKQVACPKLLRNLKRLGRRLQAAATVEPVARGAAVATPPVVLTAGATSRATLTVGCDRTD